MKSRVNILKDKENINIYEAIKENKIKEIVKNLLQLDSEECVYNEAKVKIIFDSVEKGIVVKYLIIYATYKKIYLFETIKIEINDNYEVVSIINNYNE